MLRKARVVLLALAIFISGMGGTFSSAFFSYAIGPEPEVASTAAILMNMDTGEIFYEKNADQKLEPASTTKIMTCILAIENLDLNQMITVDADAVNTLGNRLFLVEGEEISVEECLYGLMLPSGNDCAIALAKAVAGTVKDFAAMMNAKAVELGCKNTFFITPNGLNDVGTEAHRTTARDLATITRYCMKNETFRTLVSTEAHTVPATNKSQPREIKSTNELLANAEGLEVLVNGVKRPAKYDGCIGVKTGYTSSAGGCLIAAAKRDNTALLAVVMKGGGETRFSDCIALLDWGFEHYYTATVNLLERAGMEALPDIQVKRGAFNKVATHSDQEYCDVSLPIEASEAIIGVKVVLPDALVAPVEANAEIGQFQVYAAGEPVCEIPIRTSTAVEQGGILSNFGIEDATAHKIWIGLAVLAGILLVALISFIIARIRITKRKRALRKKKAMEIALARSRKAYDDERRRWPY